MISEMICFFDYKGILTYFLLKRPNEASKMTLEINELRVQSGWIKCTYAR